MSAGSPSCAQKRTLLLGEYLSEDLLLRLPHRQFVWTIPLGSSHAQRGGSPKVLRVFLRHDRDLFADIGRLLFDILSHFFSHAAGRPIRSAMISSHQTFVEFGVWQQHAYYLPLLSPYVRVNSVF